MSSANRIFTSCSVLVLVLCLSACNMTSSGSSSSGSPPDLSVVQVSDLGTIATNPDILGRDGAYSTLFQGNSVWLYGDTFLANANADNFTLISDSWSFTTDLNAQDGIAGFQEKLDSAGAPTMILPETAEEQAFNEAHNPNNCQQQPCGARWALWPSSIVVDPVQNRALIFYMLVSSLPGNFNFQGVGNSVATWQSLSSRSHRPTFNPPIVAGYPDLMFTQDEPGFGSAAFVRSGISMSMVVASPPTLLTKVAGWEGSTRRKCRIGVRGTSMPEMAPGLRSLATPFPFSPATTF
jgi:hypothetical protein